MPPKRRRRNSGDDTAVFSFARGELPTTVASPVVYDVSNDGRRVTRIVEADCPAPALPSRFPHLEFSEVDLPWQPLSEDAPDIDTTPAAEAEAELPDIPTDVPVSKDLGGRTFVTVTHDPVLLEWAPLRDDFLDELLRLDGFGGADRTRCPTCPGTSRGAPEYRCNDCCGRTVVCRQCCLEAHETNPFHRVKRWNGRFFENTTLKDAGLVLQLGHRHGERCPAPVAGPHSFTVIHTNGFHPIRVQYCQCTQLDQAGTRVQQLLRYELYPATLADTSTCCTFRALETFRMLTLQSKLTAYDYYLSLTKLTDRAGLGPRYDRLKPFLRMVREWRHLQLLKRAGRGHEPGGVNATKAGELCTRCPACPQPGVNLPENWDKISDDLKFIYTTFVAIDANFRLKRRAVSSNSRDPSLSSGWGYFVEGEAYRSHVLKYADQEDISTCTGFAAMMNANKSFRGYATTGCVMAIDARHGFVLANGVGDLQKGERNCNIDYVTMSALSLLPRKTSKVLSYDIMCQWLRYLRQRIAALPAHLRIELPEGEVRYAIPKYHFNGHKEEGHTRYSLNLGRGYGRVDGEEVERGWSGFDTVASSTVEMGPGSREETIEDHMDFHNEEKYVTMGSALDKRERKAVAGYVKHDRNHEAFVADLQPANVTEWTAMATAYEEDNTQPDPYVWKPTGMSEAEIRTNLMLKEEEEANRGAVPLHEVTPASMLATLLDLEEQQRKFKAKYPRNSNGTALQTAEVIAKRAALRHRIATIRGVQSIYMPSVSLKLALHRQTLGIAPPDVSPPSNSSGTSRRRPRRPAVAGDGLDLPEDQPLFLPSALTAEERDSCVSGLAAMESKLRDGQLADSLDKLRVHLHIRSRLVGYRNRHVRHQGASTRARTRIDQNEAKISAFKQKYRAARLAKLALDGSGPWAQRYKPLNDSDVAAIRGDDEVAGVGMSEGKFTLSWIWMGADGGDANGIRGLNDALRVEFVKSRARKERYREEILYVQAEKTQTIATLEQNAMTWDRRESQVRSLKSSSLVAEGAAAYAAERADVERRLSSKFSWIWWKTVQYSTVSTEQTDEGAELTGEGGDDGLHFAKAAAEDSDVELDLGSDDED